MGINNKSNEPPVNKYRRDRITKQKSEHHVESRRAGNLNKKFGRELILTTERGNLILKLQPNLVKYGFFKENDLIVVYDNVHNPAGF